MAKVYCITNNFLRNLRNLLKENLPAGLGKTAVKLHMGEYGNLNYLRPVWAELIVDVLKTKKAKPFLVDSPSLYPGPRDSVKGYLEITRKHGYTKEGVGAEIVVSDTPFTVKRERNLKGIEVVKEIAEAEAMIVLSHFKGHNDSGFGGAIKNLGMGAVTKKTKAEMHGFKPWVDLEKCIGCGICANVCKVQKAIKIESKKAVINSANCFGCGACIDACPQRAICSKASVRELLPEAAEAVLSTFKKSKVWYVNVLFDITLLCDCWSISSEKVCPDIGVLFSDDIVAIDKASLDLVNEKIGKDFSLYFHKLNIKPLFQKAEDLNLGKMNYQLVKV